MSTNRDEKQSLLAVLQFLKKKNLKEAEEALRKEAGLDSMSTETNYVADTEINNVLSEYESEGDPLRYEEYYEGLQQFIERSLDVHKQELAMVLYPVFVHLYLECVYKGYEAEAERFYEKFSKNQEDYRKEDLEKLCLFKKKDHMLSNNEYLNIFRSNKYVIKMSRETFNVLKNYLRVNSLDVLLNLMQQHFHLDVFDGRPRSKRTIDATTGYLTGESLPDANKSKVFFGLVHDPELMAVLAEESDDEEQNKDAKDKQKKKKTKRDEGRKRHTTDPNAPKPDRIPFPKVKDIDKRYSVNMYREIGKRLHVSATRIPSVCCYTFVNCQDKNLTCVDICEDSSLIAGGFSDSTIRLSTLTQKRLRTLKGVNELAKIDKDADDVLERIMSDKSAAESRQLYGHSGPVYGLSFNRNKSFLLSSSEDGTVRLWSMHTYTNLVSWTGHIYPVWDVKFSPQGYYFVSGSYDRTARLWCTESHQPLRIFAGHLSDVNVVDFHPNSNYVATGSSDRTVRIWDLHTGNCVRQFAGHKASVLSLKFSPDGRYLASSGPDKRILLWDVGEATPLADLTGHSSTVNSMCFSRESHLLASGGLDNCVKLWDIKAASRVDEEASEPFSNSYEISSFVTKSTPLHHLHFTRRNLLLAAGPFIPHL